MSDFLIIEVFNDIFTYYQIDIKDKFIGIIKLLNNCILSLISENIESEHYSKISFQIKNIWTF